MVAVAVLVLSAGLSACTRRGLSRDGLRDAYVAQLVDNGIDPTAAACVVDRLFESMTDDELRSFNTEGSSLTAAEAAQVAQFAEACGASPGG